MPRNSNCANCNLCQSVKTVCVWGEGPQNADVMFIGRDPGATEDEQGRPFVGAAGQILNELIEIAGLKRENVYISNIVKCRPPNNRPPTDDEKKACRTYLNEEIQKINPKIIVCLGGDSFEAITGYTGIMGYAGTYIEQNNRKIFASVHPSYILRNRPYKQIAEEHFKSLGRLVYNMSPTNNVPKVVVIAKNPNNQDGMSIQTLNVLLDYAKLIRQQIYFIDLNQPDLLQAIVNVLPAVVVTLGGECLEKITGKKGDLKTAGKLINFTKDNITFTIMPTVSLSYLTRDSGYMPRVIKHWECIGRIARGESVELPRATTNYVFIQDIEKARKLFTRMVQCKRISFDLETTGFDFQTDRILCWAFSWKPHTAVILPILGQHEKEIWSLEEKKEIKNRLKDLFKNSNIEWIAHNIAFDEKFLIQQNIHIEGTIHDTMLLSTLIDENAKDLKGLKSLAELYTDLGDYSAPLEEYTKDLKATKARELHSKKKEIKDKIKKLVKFLEKASPGEVKSLKSSLIDLEYDLEELEEVSIDISYAEIPTDILWPYAAMDADATFRIFKLFYEQKLRYASDLMVKPYGKSMVKLYNKLVMPLRKVLNDMEFLGAQLDLEYLAKLDDEYVDRTEQTEQELFAMPELKLVEQKLWETTAVKIGERYDKLKKPPGKISRIDYIKKYTKPIKFNMNSANHLCVLLYDVLKIVPFKVTPHGNPSTDAEVLEKLTEDEVHPAIAKFQENRKLQKLHKTYVKGMQKRADKNGRVHTDFNQHITVTGRLSSSHPNLQNIPRANKDIKRAFITQPGWSIVQADYSQAEFRMWGQLSQDADMIADIAAGMDIHRVTASEFWQIPEDEVTKEKRSAAKFVVFGLMYGRGAESVAKQVKIKKIEAEAIIKQFFAKYPIAARWLQLTRNFAGSNGFVINHFGRVRRLPQAKSPDRERAAEAMRQAVNAPIQGSAADMTGVALIRIWKQLRKRNLRARLILTVHDSIILECPDEELFDVVTLCHDCMTAPIEGLNVPMDAEIEVGKNWAKIETWPNDQYHECYEKYLKYGTVETVQQDDDPSYHSDQKRRTYGDMDKQYSETYLNKNEQ